MKCNVDVVRIRENSIQLNGWAIGKTPETEITYQVEDGAHQPIRFQYVATRRDDVSQTRQDPGKAHLTGHGFPLHSRQQRVDLRPGGH